MTSLLSRDVARYPASGRSQPRFLHTQPTMSGVLDAWRLGGVIALPYGEIPTAATPALCVQMCPSSTCQKPFPVRKHCARGADCTCCWLSLADVLFNNLVTCFSPAPALAASCFVGFELERLPHLAAFSFIDCCAFTELSRLHHPCDNSIT